MTDVEAALRLRMKIILYSWLTNTPHLYAIGGGPGAGWLNRVVARSHSWKAVPLKSFSSYRSGGIGPVFLTLPYKLLGIVTTLL